VGKAEGETGVGGCGVLGLDEGVRCVVEARGVAEGGGGVGWGIKRLGGNWGMCA